MTGSDDRYRQIVETSQDVIWTTDLQGRISFVNPAARRVLGYRPEDLIGEAPERLVVARDLAVATSARARLRARKVVSSLPLGLLHRDGHEVQVLANVAATHDATGRLVSVTGSATDITARRRAERALAEQRALIERLFNSSVDGILAFDNEFRISAWNPGMEAIFGLSTSEVVDRAVFDVLPFLVRSGEDRNFRATLDGFAPVSPDRRFEVEQNSRSGHIACHYSPLRDHEGATSGGLVVIRDLTAGRGGAHALRDAHEQFTQVFDNAPIGMALVELDPDVGARFVRVNQALCLLMGRAAPELTRCTLLDVTEPGDERRELAFIGRLLAGEIPKYRLEKRFRRPDGEVVWAAVTVSLLRGAEGGATYGIAQVEDVTARREDEQRIRFLADHDAMTGLFNRARFETELREQVARTVRDRDRERAAVLALDVDDFKYVNDTLGHTVGDEVVRAVAGALRAQLQEADLIARFGGDEFAVLLTGERAVDAEAIAADTVRAIREQVAAVSGRRRVRVTASVGVAAIGDGVDSADDVLARADAAMYEAKQAGKDRVAIYDQAAARHELMAARLLWTERLRRALQEDGFVLHLQPIVDVATGTPVHLEVLLRMRGEDGELHAPDRFLPVAEHFRMMPAVDRWVVREAIALAARLAESGVEMPLEINLSGASLTDVGLLEFVQEQLAAHGVDAGRLIFEVAETAAITNLDAARAFTERLKSFGARFALDDFGSGFGSYYYVKYLDFDLLKIDGEFVRSLPSSETDQLVLGSIVENAQRLGKRTVAEFVEDEETLQLLRRLGVDLAQGYHLGRPRPATDYLERKAT